MIFVLLSSQDGFSTKWHIDTHTGVKRAPALYNGVFSTIAFLVGAVSSILSGFIGMKIATYANSRTALEARKGIAAAFAVGKPRAVGPVDLPYEGPLALTGTAVAAAFRSGAVMGFALSGIGLLVLFVLLEIYKKVRVGRCFENDESCSGSHRNAESAPGMQVYGQDWEGVYEAIAGYGLGGSSIALFGRVGGGIYTKAADVGADSGRQGREGHS